ncbi:carbohydrate-binding module family 50 protein [Curvularia clavata]|uniref:Carbohydrate-binding module family 50 protein n=1 Tax=Curvularia clavata TaxID=95742 RepID=A0A9Q9DXG4_CURCL|nr:carbohydrate-binding module family 50 protein [Curvularia clavata]
MKFTLFAAATFLAATASAFPLVTREESCEGPYGELPCGSRDAQNYTVAAGDTLTTIADKFKSGACDIAKYNSISNPDLIFPNQTLVIPANCQSTPDNTSCLPKTPGGLQATGTQDCVKGLSVNPPEYEVIPGDTFTLIANNFDLKLDALKAANTDRFANFDSIFPGNKTSIPVCTGCSCTNQQYTVKSGDTFSAIATAAGITIGQIEAANPGQIPEQLQIGQVINRPLCSCVA